MSEQDDGDRLRSRRAEKDRRRGLALADVLLLLREVNRVTMNGVRDLVAERPRQLLVFLTKCRSESTTYTFPPGVANAFGWASCTRLNLNGAGIWTGTRG
jgi:hypothetical protein